MEKCAIIDMHKFLEGSASSMHTKIGKIRKMIENFANNPNKCPKDYQSFLAKCSRLDELDTRLNEMENLGRPEDAEELELYNSEIDGIGDEVRKLTSPLKEAK